MAGTVSAYMTPKSVLIIEGDADLRTCLRSSIGNNYAITEAATGHDGVRHFEQSRFDLVVLDERLPDLNGRDVLERLGDLSDGVGLILLGSEREKERLFDIDADGYLTRTSSRKYGADCYLVKPLNMVELSIHSAVLLGGRMREAGH
jgi:DNA-binding response OmpR family regulator